MAKLILSRYWQRLWNEVNKFIGWVDSDETLIVKVQLSTFRLQMLALTRKSHQSLVTNGF